MRVGTKSSKVNAESSYRRRVHIGHLGETGIPAEDVPDGGGV